MKTYHGLLWLLAARLAIVLSLVYILYLCTFFGLILYRDARSGGLIMFSMIYMYGVYLVITGVVSMVKEIGVYKKIKEKALSS